MAAPNTPTDLIDRIRTLERAVSDLAGRVNIRPALNTIVGGSVTIKDGGALIVQDTTGDSVLSIGRISPDVDGEAQMATVIRRMDGSLAFAVWTGATTGVQPVRIYDKGSNIIFADETSSAGGGLAVPWLPLPSPKPAASANLWASTTATSFASLEQCNVMLHHPMLYIHAVAATTGGTGAIRITLDGVVVATSTTTTNPSINGVFDVPSWAWTGVPQQKSLQLEAQRGTATSIAGTVRSIYGRQT